jgi:hypothetical protein
VVADDLSAIPDLQERHRRVLAGELKITTLRALVQADRRDIHRAMRNLRPRPTLEQIARWQDHARSGLSEAASDPADWRPAASFAVVFAQRQAEDGAWERRLEVERTEVEPEQEGRIWPGWDCRESCGWMRVQMGLPEGGPPSAPEPAAQQPPPGEHRQRPAPQQSPTQAPAVPTAGRAAVPATAGQVRSRGELTIARITLIDPGAQVGPVTAGTAGTAPVDVLTAGPPAEPSPPAPAGPLRVEITVSGVRRGQEIHAVARVLPRGEPGWNPQDPVVIKGGGTASFDLSRLPAGRHEVALIAWAPDGSMQPAAVTLPELTIRPVQQGPEPSP